MSLLFGLASGPDLLRLVAVPVLGWAALRDVRTRRVPNRTWLPLVAIGVVALAWDALLVAGTPRQTPFVVRVLLSVGLVAPLGYVFWRIGAFGGADAKAIMTLALVFPTTPAYYLPAGLAVPAAFPVQTARLGVFSLTILSNTVLVGLAYPLVLALRNLPRGELTPAMFIGRPVRVSAVTAEYGRLLETTAGFTRRGLDLDALRMYLRWRGVDLGTVRSNPDRYRHPLPAERNDPGDGSIVADDRAQVDAGTPTAGPAAPGPADTEGGPTDGHDAAVRPLDEWGADRFLDAHRAYGTTPRELRAGLDVLVEPDRERVWLTPGIPFILPMFAGLLIAVGYGDLLFAILSGLGLA